MVWLGKKVLSDLRTLLWLFGLLNFISIRKKYIGTLHKFEMGELYGILYQKRACWGSFVVTGLCLFMDSCLRRNDIQNRLILPAEVGESFVGFSHFVSIQFLLDCGTGIFVGFNDFGGNFVGKCAVRVSTSGFGGV